ncbi:hypothetical protein IG631_21190 [Alternaria alternata]|nr:hypothetical protein IG631_21190 [Alternaria alternata]
MSDWQGAQPAALRFCSYREHPPPATTRVPPTIPPAKLAKKQCTSDVVVLRCTSSDVCDPNDHRRSPFGQAVAGQAEPERARPLSTTQLCGDDDLEIGHVVRSASRQSSPHVDLRNADAVLGCDVVRSADRRRTERRSCSLAWDKRWGACAMLVQNSRSGQS